MEEEGKREGQQVFVAGGGNGALDYITPYRLEGKSGIIKPRIREKSPA